MDLMECEILISVKSLKFEMRLENNQADVKPNRKNKQKVHEQKMFERGDMKTSKALSCDVSSVKFPFIPVQELKEGTSKY